MGSCGSRLESAGAHQATLVNVGITVGMMQGVKKRGTIGVDRGTVKFRVML